MANDNQSGGAKTGTSPKTDETPDTPTADVGTTPDVQAAKRSGVSEGEIKALRDESGLNGLPGHEADVKQWEASDEGKAFVKEAKDTKEAEKAAKSAHEGLDKDGKSEAVKKYEEVVG